MVLFRGPPEPGAFLDREGSGSPLIHASPRSMSPVTEEAEPPSDTEAPTRKTSSVIEDADLEGWQHAETAEFVRDLLQDKKGRLYHFKFDETKSKEEKLAQWREHDRPALKDLDHGEP